VVFVAAATLGVAVLRGALARLGAAFRARADALLRGRTAVFFPGLAVFRAAVFFFVVAILTSSALEELRILMRSILT
jgi:hypothetical protein